MTGPTTNGHATSNGTTKRDIARRVAAARKLADMTQGQLARRLTELTDHPWSRDVVASMETARRTIPAELLIDIGEAVGVNPE